MYIRQHVHSKSALTRNSVPLRGPWGSSTVFGSRLRHRECMTRALQTPENMEFECSGIFSDLTEIAEAPPRFDVVPCDLFHEPNVFGIPMIVMVRPFGGGKESAPIC